MCCGFVYRFTVDGFGANVFTFKPRIYGIIVWVQCLYRIVQLSIVVNDEKVYLG